MASGPQPVRGVLWGLIGRVKNVMPRAVSRVDRLSSVRVRMHVVPTPLRPARLCLRSGLSPASYVT